MPIPSRALRTALGATLLVAVTAGILSSGQHQDPAAVAAGSPTASPSVQVDPVTGSPVGIDPTGPVAPGSSSAAPGGAATPSATATATTVATLPGRPTPAKPTGSDLDPVTVHGYGDFTGLAVTVHQTTDLVDQSVNVTWTGGQQTLPMPGTFGQNYLQLMECWGDAAAGPDRTQCQYGSYNGDNRGGAYVGTRQLNYASLVDPKETIKQAKGQTGNVYVPFHSVRGTVDSNGTSTAFDLSSTNEVPFAPTRTDGTGQAYFETETNEEAPGLGCGAVPDNLRTTPKEGRKCWLVIVPRGLTEVDGSIPLGDKLVSSPLSASNWANRLVVPLHYSPLGYACPINAADLHTYGTEMAKEAMIRWAPVLCQNTGSNFRYTKVDDNIARAKLNAGDDPGLVFVSDPTPTGQVAPGRNPVYAPIGLSGVTIAFDIESQSSGRAPTDVQERNGRRITQLNLTPRLVAKLLTQSYRYGTDYQDPDPVLAHNALDLTTDQDFLQYNPQFKALYFGSRIYDIEVPLGQSDVARRLWAWVEADPDARAFLSGKKDTWGMQVNPNYRVPKAMSLPRDDFPKSDPYCVPYPADSSGKIPKLCTLDAHPYANDMHDSARSASRGDNLSHTVWDNTVVPPAFTKGAAQAAGLRGILAVTDTPTAIRYGLDTASLLNGAGRFVAPSTASMLAGAAAMTTVKGSTAQTLAPTAKGRTVYPLTMLTYAATAPASLPRSEAEQYASLIDYAVGRGQTLGFDSGKLSLGYVPLPQKLRTQALAAAKTMVANSMKPPVKAGPTHAAPSSGGGHDSAPAPTATPARQVVTVAPTAPSSARIVRTAATPVGAAHYLLVGLLGAGAAAALAGPLLPRYLRRKRR
ncbi:hypothetical protein ACEZCY_16735 [Streptacidiphilus sp. N1-12]|uniref:PBP domain-containing protein n=2 Tax=Streptacidiphilus alkalitolerans TaxID=3342712 RepID=A0ABV6WGH6_9ACTN